ncbi:hypothetical protein Tco_0617305 [Tanacetum coccineum]
MPKRILSRNTLLPITALYTESYNYGSSLLILSAYASSMPPILSLPLYMAYDDSDGMVVLDYRWLGVTMSLGSCHKIIDNEGTLYMAAEVSLGSNLANNEDSAVVELQRLKKEMKTMEVAHLGVARPQDFVSAHTKSRSFQARYRTVAATARGQAGTVQGQPEASVKDY